MHVSSGFPPAFPYSGVDLGRTHGGPSTGEIIDQMRELDGSKAVEQHEFKMQFKRFLDKKGEERVTKPMTTSTETKPMTAEGTKPNSGEVAVMPETDPATEPAKPAEPVEDNKKDKLARMKSKIATLESENSFLTGENKALEERIRDRDRTHASMRDKLTEACRERDVFKKERDELLLKAKKKERFADKEQAKQIDKLKRKVQALESSAQLARDNPNAKLAEAQKLATDRQAEIARLKGVIGDLQSQVIKLKAKK